MIQGKNGYELLTLTNQNPNSYLFITTPFYSESIPLDTNPLDVCSDLALNCKPGKYENPQYYIRFEDNADYFSLFIKVKASNYNDIPNFQAKFPNDFKISDALKGKDVLTQICNCFDLEITDPSSNTFKSTDSSKNIIKFAHNHQLELVCTLTEKSLKRIQHRNQILEEIIATENTYISDLKRLLDYWEEKLKASKIFTKNEMVALFREIPGIIQCHSMFFNVLQQRKPLYSTQVSDIFLDFSDFFKVSLPYISNYDSLLNIIQSKLANKNSNKIFMDETNGRDFASYLITPVQRMPRYRLFIRELVKYTPKSHPDAPFIEYVSEKIHEVTQEMNEATEKAEKMNSLFIIQKKIGKQYHIIESFRTLKMVSNVICDKTPCSFYIFSDIVMLNAIDRFLSGETVLFVSKISEFKYFPSVNFLTFSLKKKLKVVLFESLADFSQFVTKLEECRAMQYEKENILLTAFLWSTPLLVDPLPNLNFTVGVTIDNFYYFFGDSKLIKVDLQKSTVNIIESPITYRTGFSMSSLNNKIYIFGGKNGKLHEYYNDTWEFDADNNTWTELKTSKTPTPRCEHSSVIYENKLIVFGGRCKKHYYNDLFILDLNTLEWSNNTCKQSPMPRSLHSASIYNDQMILYGGKSSRSVLNDIYIYDLQNNSWKALYLNLSIIPKRYGHRTVVFDDFLFVIGGTKNDNVSENPMVLKCKSGYAVVDYESAGNNPLLLTSFGLCVDSKRNMLIAYISNSLYRIQLPSEIEDVLPQLAAIEVKARSHSVDAAKRVKQRKTIQTFGGNQEETEQIIKTFGSKKLEMNEIMQLHLMDTGESQETTESSTALFIQDQIQPEQESSLNIENSVIIPQLNEDQPKSESLIISENESTPICEVSINQSNDLDRNDDSTSNLTTETSDNQEKEKISCQVQIPSTNVNESNGTIKENYQRPLQSNPRTTKSNSSLAKAQNPKSVNLHNNDSKSINEQTNQNDLPHVPSQSQSLPEMNLKLNRNLNNRSAPIKQNQTRNKSIPDQTSNGNKVEETVNQQKKPPLPPKQYATAQNQTSNNQAKQSNQKDSQSCKSAQNDNKPSNPMMNDAQTSKPITNDNNSTVNDVPARKIAACDNKPNMSTPNDTQTSKSTSNGNIVSQPTGNNGQTITTVPNNKPIKSRVNDSQTRKAAPNDSMLRKTTVNETQSNKMATKDNKTNESTINDAQTSKVTSNDHIPNKSTANDARASKPISNDNKQSKSTVNRQQNATSISPIADNTISKRTDTKNQFITPAANQQNKSNELLKTSQSKPKDLHQNAVYVPKSQSSHLLKNDQQQSKPSEQLKSQINDATRQKPSQTRPPIPKKSNSLSMQTNEIQNSGDNPCEKSSALQTNNKKKSDQAKCPPPRSASQQNHMTEQAIDQLVDYTSKFVPGNS